MQAPAAFRRPSGADAVADQLVVTLGVICANQKSDLSRSPALNWASLIIACPSLSRRWRSQLSGLSAMFTSGKAGTDPGFGAALPARLPFPPLELRFRRNSARAARVNLPRFPSPSISTQPPAIAADQSSRAIMPI